jgi:hypothetical protein
VHAGGHPLLVDVERAAALDGASLATALDGACGIKSAVVAR